MTLPVAPPVSPMLAKLARELPEDEGLLYEPKWDGFRCIVFRDGVEVVLGSRNEKPLNRYFPELVESLRDQLPDRCVVDGEIVIAGPQGLDFDVLSQRIHPAASRGSTFWRADHTGVVRRVRPTGAGRRRTCRPRRSANAGARLETALRASNRPSISHRSPTARGGPRLVLPVRGSRVSTGSSSRRRTALPAGQAGDDEGQARAHRRLRGGGFRWHKEGGVVGSLLLGLFDDEGVLHHVGVASGFSAARRRELVAELDPYRQDAAAVTRGSVDGETRCRAGSRAGRAGGVRERTSAGSRCVPIWSSRWPTTTSRATVSAMRPRSFAGDPTATPASCTY